jgi:hypothetical protein
MKSRATRQFWKHFERLPTDIQRKAYKAYRLWRRNPSAKGLYFKRVSGVAEPLYSVRIGMRYRALGLLDGDTLYWYWIGDHDEYDRALG